jgi:hypothetical protein
VATIVSAGGVVAGIVLQLLPMLPVELSAPLVVIERFTQLPTIAPAIVTASVALIVRSALAVIVTRQES